MALKRIYDSQDEIPEGLEAYYVERSGKWVLDAEPGEGEKAAQDVERALRARDNEKAEREKLRTQLEELTEKFEGIDPDKIPDIVESQKRLEELEHQQLIEAKKFEEAAEKKFERRLAEMNRNLEQTKRQMQERDAKMADQRKKLETIMIEGALQSEFIKNQTDPQKLRYLLLDARSKWELDPETDEPIPIDYTEGGHTKVTAVGADGKRLTMQEHVKSILADNPWAVLESTGSGSRHQQRTGANGAFTMTETEAADFGRFKAVKAQAEKAGVDFQIVPG